ncbi:MAG: DinB family protein [Flavobacteriaceae bacterium]|nr:DinB family protein [Flavobacteriaceae bacterium]
MSKKIESNEYASFYQTYIDRILENDRSLVENLEDSLQVAFNLLKDIDKDKQSFKYADDKWTIKELVQHIIDTERIFNYRALRFARNDKTELSGFDENDFADTSNANRRKFTDLLEEFSALRKSTIFLYNSFDEKTLMLQGNANSSIMSVRALGYVTSGHLLHHLHIIKSRYL